MKMCILQPNSTGWCSHAVRTDDDRLYVRGYILLMMRDARVIIGRMHYDYCLMRNAPSLSVCVSIVIDVP